MEGVKTITSERHCPFLRLSSFRFLTYTSKHLACGRRRAALAREPEGLYMSWGQNSAYKDLDIRCLRFVDFQLAMCVAIGNLRGDTCCIMLSPLELRCLLIVTCRHVFSDTPRMMPHDTLNDACRHPNQPVPHTFFSDAMLRTKETIVAILILLDKLLCIVPAQFCSCLSNMILDVTCLVRNMCVAIGNPDERYLDVDSCNEHRRWTSSGERGGQLHDAGSEGMNRHCILV